jgi:hypothetical protein
VGVVVGVGYDIKQPVLNRHCSSSRYCSQKWSWHSGSVEFKLDLRRGGKAVRMKTPKIPPAQTPKHALG